jgi:hypothetical protein
MNERSKVLWLGRPPEASDLREHAQRGLTVFQVEMEALARDAVDLTQYCSFRFRSPGIVALDAYPGDRAWMAMHPWVGVVWLDGRRVHRRSFVA